MGKLAETKLVEITRREVEKRRDSDSQRAGGADHAWIIVQAQVVGDVVMIDEDNVFDKKLVHALTQASVPREQIVLQYAGEAVPAMKEEPSP